MRPKILVVVLLLTWLVPIPAAPEAAGSGAPEPVSPGSPLSIEPVGDECPTFSWGSMAGARGYRLVVYELGTGGELGEVVIEHRLGSGASSWTPPLRQGLTPGTSYAWTVGVETSQAETVWSEPALFRVAPRPSVSELEQALDVMRRYLSAHDSHPTAPPMPAAVERETTIKVTEQDPLGPQRVPESPSSVSLVTDGAVGVGTSSPLADLHVVGSPSVGGILLSPDSTGAGSSELLLSEDKFGFGGVKLKYVGAGDKLQIWGRVADQDRGPWL